MSAEISPFESMARVDTTISFAINPLIADTDKSAVPNPSGKKIGDKRPPIKLSRPVSRRTKTKNVPSKITVPAFETKWADFSFNVAAIFRKVGKR